MKTQNELKAKEIAKNIVGNDHYSYFDDFKLCAMQAMEWKDEQHAKEKQQWIEKACKLMQHWILEHDYVDIMELEDYIKQQIEE